MKKADVEVGRTYIVRVSGRLVQVRLDRTCGLGGWYGTSLATGRAVRIRTAARLRAPARDLTPAERAENGARP